MPVYFMREVIDTSESREMQLNRQYRDLVRDTVQSLSVSLPGSAIEEDLDKGNTFALAGGDHVGPDLNKPNSHIRGLPPSSAFTSQVGINSNAIVEGMLFKSSAENRGALALVGAGVTSVFRNCVFEKVEQDISYHIEMATSTSKILAIGCVFIGPSKSTPILLNPGVAASAVFVGCFDQTGNGYGTSTQVGCL